MGARRLAVALSFGIPFAPLRLHLTASRDVMGDYATTRTLRVTGFIAAVIVALNCTSSTSPSPVRASGDEAGAAEETEIGMRSGAGWTPTLLACWATSAHGTLVARPSSMLRRWWRLVPAERSLEEVLMSDIPSSQLAGTAIMFASLCSRARRAVASDHEGGAHAFPRSWRPSAHRCQSRRQRCRGCRVR